MPSTKWTAKQMPDMTGKTVVITGASSGIGVVTAAEMARAGAKVVLAVRDVDKGKAVAASMTGNTEVRALDLTSLASIRTFASEWSGDLDILINNAGIMMVPKGRTADGFEKQFGTNHLGHFALTNLLLPHIRDRVVTVSSDLHKRGKINIDDLNFQRRRYRPLSAYCQSKLANILFTLELQRRLTAMKSPVLAVSCHPGVAKTNLTGHMGGLKGATNRFFLRFISQSAEGGAAPTLYAATQAVPAASYVGPDGLIHTKGYPEVSKSSKASHDAVMAKKLWDASAKLTNTDVPVAATV